MQQRNSTEIQAEKRSRALYGKKRAEIPSPIVWLLENDFLFLRLNIKIHSISQKPVSWFCFGSNERREEKKRARGFEGILSEFLRENLDLGGKTYQKFIIMIINDHRS